jgi:hypothetical protein
VFCEIASRTGGMLIRETIQQGFGLDLTQISVQAQCGMEIALPPSLQDGSSHITHGGFLLLPAREGVLTLIPEKYPEWVTLSVISAIPGQIFSGSESIVDTVASFRVQGQSEGQVEERVWLLPDYFERQAKWESREGELSIESDIC